MDYEDDGQDESRRFAALCTTLKGYRDEAVKGRAASGIEAEWLEDEEYFQGIDAANRGERAIKPTSPDGRVQIASSKQKKASRSTVFVNITRPYVNAAAAKMADMLFPTDDSNFDMRPTPIPDLIRKSADMSPAFDQNGQPIMKTKVGVEDGQPVLLNGQPIRQQATNADVAEQEMKEAKQACEKAKTKISDWLVQCGYHGEGRQVIEDSARIGTGVIKGPFPENVRKRAVVKALEGIGMVIKDEIIPKSKRIDVWNLYPDPSCGESIHNGKYVFEYDEISARKLQELKRDPSYLADAIDKVIEEGPKDHMTGYAKRSTGAKPNDKETYGIWYFSGYLSREDMETAGYKFEEETEETEESGLIGGAEAEGVEGECLEESDETLSAHASCGCDENEQFPALVIMVNDTVIKATMQPLDSGEFPYDVMPWQRRPGHWAGIGVSRQMRTSQDGVNAATRNLMDNAGVSGSPILIVDRNKIEPVNGVWGTSTKVYYTTERFEGGNIRDAFTWILAPSMQAELMNIIQFWMQRAEDETGLPMLLQGQLGKAPDTVGGMTILNNNGSAVMRRIARQFDDCITEPHIGRYYEWLLMHEDDDSMKGDFTIDARGSSALIERDAHAQLIPQLVGVAANPASGLDLELVVQEMLKSQRFDADKLKLSDEKKKQMQEQAQKNQPQDSRPQVAQINAEGRSRDLAAKLAHEAQQADMDRALAQWEKNMEAQIAAAQLSGDQAMNADELKVAMARETMKLRTQMRLAMQGNAPQVATPAMEPPGRAPNGEAFQL